MADKGLNKAQLIGRLGMDPELKHTNSGKAVLRLRVATSEQWKDRQGERQERTEWHTVVVWDKHGEALNKYLSKGDKVFVEGRIKHRQWEDQQGNKRNATDIVADDVIMLGSPSRSGGGGPPSSSGSGDSAAASEFGDEDIPF